VPLLLQIFIIRLTKNLRRIQLAVLTEGSNSGAVATVFV